MKEYLELCINSVINQTYENIEIILVDDGSPDECGSICDEFSLKDKRIKVIHKENGGLSSARNAALDVMSGEYVTFVDGDDYIDSRFVEILVNEMISSDSTIAVCDEETFSVEKNEVIHNMGSRFRRSDQTLYLSGRKGLELLLAQKYYDVSAWGKIYKSELFEGIRYPIGKVHEDVSTTYKIFLRTKKTVFVNRRLYHYCIRDGSIMRNNDRMRFLDLMNAADKQEKDILREAPELFESVNSRTISAYFQAYEGLRKCNDADLSTRAWKKIVLLRKSVIFSKKSRLKAKVASVLTFLGPSVVFLIQKHK